MSKILILGGVSRDKIIYLNDFKDLKPGTVFSRKSIETIGSTGSGKALSLSKLGMNTTLHAMIGDDNQGRCIIDVMKTQGVTFLYDIDSAGTEEHVNIMDERGDRISIYTKYASFEPNVDWSKIKKLMLSSDYLVLNIINYVKQAIPLAKHYKKEIWCDIHDYDGKNEYHQEFIDAADHLFVSSDCLEDYKSFMIKMMEQGKKTIVCTHGKDGVTAINQNSDFIDLPILDQYDRVDTNGAGDNFFAGFIYAYDKGCELKTCMEYGTIVAGLCIHSNEIAHPDLSVEYIESEYSKYYERRSIL